LSTVQLATRTPAVKRQRDSTKPPTSAPSPACSVAFVDARQADADERAIERIETQLEQLYQQALENDWLDGGTDLEAERAASVDELSEREDGEAHR